MENENEAIEVNSEVYAIAEFNEAEATIEAIKEKCDFIPDVSTKEGLEKSKRLSIDIGKGLTKIKEVCKREKRFLADKGKQVQVQADSLIERIEKYQLPHKEAYKAKDAEVKEEREAMEIKMQSLIRITSTARADRWSSDMITDKINELLNDDCLQYGSKAADAIVQKKLVIDTLEAFRVEVIKAEADAEELAQLRRDRAEKEEADAQAEIANAGTVNQVAEDSQQLQKDINQIPAAALPPTAPATVDKCQLLIGVIESMFNKHREFMIQETLADESELPTYAESVEKKRVEGIMAQ